MVRLMDARYLSGFRVWLQFSDGRSGELNLERGLEGPIFEPLRDVRYFSQLRFDPELDNIVWPNGADLAPEFLYEQATGQPYPWPDPWPRILEAQGRGGRQLWLKFDDGVEGVVELEGPDLEGIEGSLPTDPEPFRQVEIGAEGYILEWPNGALVSAPALHKLLRSHTAA